MLFRLYRALRLYYRLNYSWHLAWYKGSHVIAQNTQSRNWRN